MAFSSIQLLQATSPSLFSRQPSNTRCTPLHAVPTCSTMAELKQYHSQIAKLGLSSDNDAVGRLVKFCALSTYGDLGYALKLFDTLPRPDAFIYNVLFRGYLRLQLPLDCIDLYSLMLRESVAPNKFSFPPVVRACSAAGDVQGGKQVHAHAIKFGFGFDAFSQNNLIHMYACFGFLEEARRVFNQMPHPDSVSWTTLISGYSEWGQVDDARKLFDAMPERTSAAWNAMIAAYTQSNHFREAFDLFNMMRSEEVPLDKFVAASMLSACTRLGALKQGEWIHGYIQRSSEIELDSKLATTIIDMYCKCGCLDKAFKVFNGLPCKGISSWNSMIGGLASHGRGEAAIELFREMERDSGAAPDYITFVNLLSACAHSGLVKEGHYFFRYMTEIYRITPGREHYGCMVDLLGRAGLLDQASKLIETMPVSTDAGIMGALLGACRIHGNIELAEKIGNKVIELEPHNSGRYVLLANIYADAGRWEDVANVRKLMNDRGVKKTPGFSLIEVGGTVNEFIAGGRAHPDSKEIYDKVNKMLDGIKSIGYRPDVSNTVPPHKSEEDEAENPSYYHSEKLAIAFGLLKGEPGEVLRIMKNLRVCRDCHQASKLISKHYNREIIVRDGNRFHHFREGECSCNDCW